jgi:hypothetical protein
VFIRGTEAAPHAVRTGRQPTAATICPAERHSRPHLNVQASTWGGGEGVDCLASDSHSDCWEVSGSSHHMAVVVVVPSQAASGVDLTAGLPAKTNEARGGWGHL